MSAAVGGQWTQVGKDGVEKWGITDRSCQLCHKHPGTTEHRFTCEATVPSSGWPAPPAKARLAINRLSATRKQYLRHHGLLVLRLPAPPVNTEGTFKWIVQPPVALEHGQEVCWHFDGSMLNGRWKPFRSTGFGIVVTSASGDLLAFGNGQPPHWCKTAAAAEAWALCTVIMQSPFLPAIRTDCLSLIATAAAGIAKATEPRKLLAQVWVLIGHALDGDLQQLADNTTLVWVPAHTSPAAVGEAKRSDGQRLSHVDWRANRLADGLAKQAAATTQPPSAVLRLLASARLAVGHFAKLLGRVTHAANNHVVQEVSEDGTVTSHTKRDSVGKPKQLAAARAQRPVQPPAPSRGRQPAVRAWTPAPPCGRRGQRSSTPPARRLVRLEQEHLERRVQEVGARLRPSSQQPGSARLDALRQRVLGAAGDSEAQP